MIRRLEWDSRVFGLEAGTVEPPAEVPSVAELAGWEHVHVRVPHDRLELVWRYEALGFRFVTVDLALRKRAAPAPPEPVAGLRLEHVRRAEPPFDVRGFDVQGSRLALDPFLAARLPRGFWDDLLRGHCREFADLVIGAVDAAGALVGAVTCFERPDALDLFLVAVRGDQQGRGVGRALLAEAERVAHAAGLGLTTSVLAHNASAMDFYAARGFRTAGGDVVLHARPHGGE